MKMKQKNLLIIVNIVLIFCFFLTACDQEVDDDSNLPARYGEFGRNIANELAEKFPERFPGSDQEEQAANWLVSELEDLGYEPQIQNFSAIDSDGNGIESQNVIVEIAGMGFHLDDEDENSESTMTQSDNTESKSIEQDVNKNYIIIGAHYDTPIKTNVIQESGDGDGIHNNAAGVASLITLAQQMKDLPPGYTTKLIFFGAGEANFAGSIAYFENMTEEEKSSLEVMYNVDRIYAGDKVYAHSGVNSIISEYEKDYEKRQKLYEMTDVYYNNLLLTNNDFALYTNQNIFSVDSPATGESALFREWTTHIGDHTVFDEAGIPIVFIESFEYDVDSYAELGKETTDSYFANVNGIIDFSNLDSSNYLNTYFEAAELEETEEVFVDSSESQEDTESGVTQIISLENLKQNKNIDRLERRVNNVAFLLLECSRYAGSDYDLND